MKRPCLGCGRLIDTASGSYCARCAKTSPRQTTGRGTTTEAAEFRRAVFARAGGRCERCGRRNARVLHAHHKRPLRFGGSNDAATNGEALCGRCHPIAERESVKRWSPVG